MSRKQQSVAYWGAVMAGQLAAGNSEQRIRADLRYVVEYSEVLGVSDIDQIVEIAKGEQVA